MTKNLRIKTSLIFTITLVAMLATNHGFGADTEKASKKPYRPNIIMITCHDIGHYIGCYGVPTVQTPNIDKLADKGVRFKNIVSTSCVCSPGRASLHTGRYPQSNGLVGLTHSPWWWSLNKDECHTASYLKKLGYETYLIGLQHLGESHKRLGYDHRFSRKHRAPESVAATIDVLKKRKPTDKPLFIKLGFFEVHRPFKHEPDTEKGLHVPLWLKNTPQIREDLALFQAEIKYFDQQVGQVLDTLEKSAIADDTLVILTAEHGIPYVGAKWTLRKTGIEIPLIIHQPKTAFTGGKVYKQLMSNVDILPTLLDFLDAPIPDRIEGVSFKKVLEGKTEKSPRRAAYSQFTPAMKRDNESRSIMTDRYHLIWYVEAGRTLPYPVDVHPKNFADHIARTKTSKRARPFLQLYDMKNDPDELKNIASRPENAKIVKNLSKKLLDWMKKVDDPLLKGPTASPYYKKAIKTLHEKAGK